MIGNVILDRYRIEKLLGEGGFGAVYKAQDVKLGRMVALKILNHVARQNPEHTRRFIDEAKVTSQLSHRNIPVVYEYGQSEDGQLFIVTELFIGGSLEEILGCVSLSPRQASWITTEVNEALVAAHQQGITHRDVKPPNIYLHRSTSGEEVKLLDFGIAKLNNHESHTLTGQLFGTPYFMSPEQILGRRDITPAADLYSLGAVLFYNLTSTVPFDGDSQFVIFNKHVNSPVPLLNDRVTHLNSLRLQQLLELLMEKNPLDRPQSAYEAREILAEIEYITQQLDPRPRLNLLDQWEYSTARDFPATTAATPIIDTKLFEAIETPVDLISPTHSAIVVGNALIDIDDFDLSEEITSAPMNDQDEWRPTAKLELRAITDALIDEDDTTDNLPLSRSNHGGLRSSQSLSQPPSSPSNPLFLSTSNVIDQKISTPPEPSFGPHSTQKREEVTQFFSDDQLILNGQPWFKVKNLWFAVSVFCVGLMISLNWFDDGSTPKLSVQTQPSTGDLSQQHTATHEVKVTPPLIFPAELPSPRAEIKNTSDPTQETGLKSPLASSAVAHTSKTISKRVRRKPHNTSKKSKRKPTSRKMTGSRDSSSSGFSQMTQSQKKFKNKRRSAASGKSKTKNSIDRFNIVIKVIVKPALKNGSSYDPGDQVRLSSLTYVGRTRQRNIKVYYEISTRKKGKYRKLSKSLLTLKRTQYVRACTHHDPRECSKVIRLFVLDSNQTADDLLP
jgi:serine/threonine protein kinase